MNLTQMVADYFDKRGLKWPDVNKALQFAHTEAAEVYEILLARDGGWVRNNPGDKPSFTKDALGEELGDWIMMLIVAGIVEGVDPIRALESKMERKLKESVHGKE